MTNQIMKESYSKWMVFDKKGVFQSAHTLTHNGSAHYKELYDFEIGLRKQGLYAHELWQIRERAKSFRTAHHAEVMAYKAVAAQKREIGKKRNNRRIRHEWTTRIFDLSAQRPPRDARLSLRVIWSVRAEGRYL